MKKILAITTIRSDYDLMSNLYRLINNDNDFELQLLVAGAHMSYSYGNSFQLIEKDGFDVLAKLETLIDSNSKQARIKTASLLLQNSIDIVADYNPDLIMYAGDREDTLVGAMLGGYLQIPTAHFFGGDHSKDGHIDNPVRHAVSKLSSLHFVSTENHKKRLQKMGEASKRIFNIGSISLDKFINEKTYDKNRIREYFQLKSQLDDYALVIFHPQDIEMEYSDKIFESILDELKKRKITAFVSYPNTDPGNKKIIDVINRYEANKNFVFYKNLERDMFLTLYKNAFFQIGNSSAGIIESASIPIPVVNVGIRQEGREQSGNVVFCKSEKDDIKKAISIALSNDFLEKVKNIRNIYGDGKSTIKAYNILKNINYKDFLYKTEDPLESNYE